MLAGYLDDIERFSSEKLTAIPKYLSQRLAINFRFCFVHGCIMTDFDRSTGKITTKFNDKIGEINYISVSGETIQEKVSIAVSLIQKLLT
eukprot:UN02457